MNNKIVEAIKDSVLSLHKKAGFYHQRKKENKSSMIRYGRSPSLSNYFEEVFGEALSKVYPNRIILIDYPIRLYDKHNKSLSSQNIYPDIIITTKDYILKGIIEIKNDLGHLDPFKLGKSNREVILKKTKYGEINEIVGRYSKQKYDAKRIKIQFPKKYKKIVLVVSLINQHSVKVNSLINQHSVEKVPKSKVYKDSLTKLGYESVFLLEKTHYNYFDDVSEKIMEEIEKKKKEIIQVFKDL